MSKLIATILLITAITSPSSTIEISPTIVGGRDAFPGQFPYMVSIQEKALRGSHGCGGGIINNRWILTAAHCLLLEPVELYAAVVGTVRMDEGGTIYEIERLVRHPKYNIYSPSNWHDIGLMKTTTEIIFNEFTQPIPLGRRRIIGNIRATAAGFGSYFSNLTLDSPITDMVMARHLQYMETRILTSVDCSLRTIIFNAINPSYPVQIIIHPMSHICSVQPRGIGLCFGDSGSILIANGEAIGIVSTGVRVCAQSHAAPDIYTRISSYIDWIESYINDSD